MKKMIILVVALFLFATNAEARTLKTGTYALSGGNSEWSSSGYQGEVVIAPQGDNYKVIWRINNRQAQVGVGIFQNDILSVAFTDASNPSFWGVASFRLKPFGEIEGRWTSFGGTTSKPEYLIWKSDLIY